MIKGGPRIVTDGLVLCLDAHDAKSYAGEPTTNLLLYPESINSGPTQESWSGTITQNAVTAPDGTMTATKIEATSGYVYERLYINTNYNGVSFGVGDTITYSVWIKMLDGTETTSNGPYIWNYNSPTYGIVVRDLSGLGPDWKLYKMTYTIQSHQTNFSMSYSASNGGVTGTYAIWHPQLEVKSYNTPYVKTSRSATNGWVDRSGNSNSGTLTNMIGTEVTHYRDGQVIMPVANSYLDFDGSNDYVDIGNTTDIFPSGSQSHSLTVSLWGKVASTSSNRIIYGQQNVANERLYIGVLNGTWEFGWGTYAWGNGNSGNAAGATTNWTNLVLVIGNGVADLYVNGVATISKTDTSVNLQGKHPIGAYYYINSYDANLSNVCSVAQCYMYNRALTAAEVLQNYNATKGRFS